MVENELSYLKLWTHIPWEVLTIKKQQIVKDYLYNNKTFEDIAFSLKTTKSKIRYDYYASLTKLSKYAVMRQFLDNKGDQLNPKTFTIMNTIYWYCNNVDVSAKHYNTTTSAIYKRINRVIKEFDITWHVFVKKEKDKIIYNIPPILR